jgi:ABC-type bacteriocin/lantibiotic exporter with double-glycine peptidase domain
MMLGVLTSSPAQAIERQRATNWCWASAIQDVLAPAGITTSQEEVVYRLNGWMQDRPASTYEVQNLVRSYGVPAQVIHRPGNVNELVNTLLRGHKIIALARPNNGFVGHFIVIEGLTDYGVIVADPANGMTTVVPVASLYTHWRWDSSIVIGRASRGIWRP